MKSQVVTIRLPLDIYEKLKVKAGEVSVGVYIKKQIQKSIKKEVENATK